MNNIKPTLIFLHILKTAGTTLNIILENYYPPERTFATFPNRRHPEGSLEGFRALSAAEKANIDLLTGHMGFGLHRDLPRPAVYITILRDPVERVVSRYYHEKRDPLSHAHDMIQKGMGLAEYAQYYAEHARMDNLQTRMIAGNWELRGHGPCTTDMLETAKQNLRNHFAIVGLTERFDETYLLLTRHFGWSPISYLRHNVAGNRPPLKKIHPEDRQALESYNQFDGELYKYAQQLFAEQLRQQEMTFPLLVKKFQFFNWLDIHFSSLRRFSLRVYLKKQLLRFQ